MFQHVNVLDDNVLDYRNQMFVTYNKIQYII